MCFNYKKHMSLLQQYLFLDGVLRNEAVHADRPLLPDAVSPVHRLQVRLREPRPGVVESREGVCGERERGGYKRVMGST